MGLDVIGQPLMLADGTRLPLSKAIRAGDFVFLSGQLGFGADARIVSGGIEAQTRQCLENIKAVLAEAGAELADVVRANIWLTDASEFGAFNAVYAEYFAQTPPARSAVCSALMLPEAKVEIEVTAYRPQPD